MFYYYIICFSNTRNSRPIWLYLVLSKHHCRISGAPPSKVRLTNLRWPQNVDQDYKSIFGSSFREVYNKKASTADSIPSPTSGSAIPERSDVTPLMSPHKPQGEKMQSYLSPSPLGARSCCAAARSNKPKARTIDFVFVCTCMYWCSIFTVILEGLDIKKSSSKWRHSIYFRIVWETDIRYIC